MGCCRGREAVLTKGAPDRLASSSVQHGLFAGDIDFELHGFHLGPIELQNKRGQERDGHYREPGAATLGTRQGAEDEGFSVRTLRWTGRAGGRGLGSPNLSNGLICRLHLFVGDEGTAGVRKGRISGGPQTYCPHAACSPGCSSLLSGWVHGEVNDVSKGGEGPSEEGGCHVLSIHIQSIPLPRGPPFGERV